MSTAETQRQRAKLAAHEIEELRESLRYAEFLLHKTKQEKEQVERELALHDEKVQEVRREVRDREAHSKQLEQQLATVNNHAHFAEMAATKVQEMAKAKLFQLQTEIA